MKRLGAVAIVLGLAGLGLAVRYTPNIFADDDNRERVKIFDRNSVVYGRTYGEWDAAWWQWADSIPTSKHPLFENGDCSVGQSGPVWFLGEKFVAKGDSADFTNVVRSCKVPAGKALYVAIYNAEDSVIEEAGFSQFTQIADLRAVAAAEMDPVTNLNMQVDGENIRDIKERFRMQSPAFGFTLPANNFWTAVGEGPFTEGTYFPSVDDGYYVMVAPLPVGHHTIHCHATKEPYLLDITYHIYVYH